MKRILPLIVCLFVTVQSIAQPKPVQSFDKEKFQLTEIINNLTADQATLFARAQSWVASSFKSAKDVIQMENKESGRIITKGNILVDGSKGGFGNTLGSDYVYFTATIDLKDKKCRIILNGFDHEGGFYGGHNAPSGGQLINEKPDSKWIGKKRWLRMKSDVYNKSVDLLNTFLSTLENKSGSNIPNDDF